MCGRDELMHDVREQELKEQREPDVIETLFTFHPPNDEQVRSYQSIREVAKDLARVIHELVPAGPDRTAAIRKVREAVMTANAGIATNNAAAKYR